MNSVSKRTVNGNLKEQSPLTDTNLSDDDDTVDEAKKSQNNEESDNSDDENKEKTENLPVPEELKKSTKRAKTYKPFTEEMLTGPDGLTRVYEDFPKITCFNGRGSEAKDIKRLITMYKEWAFQLHPGVAFQDVLIKCENMGSKGKIRANLQHLRDVERNRYLVDVLDMKHNSDDITDNNEKVEFEANNNSDNNIDNNNSNNNNNENDNDSDDESDILIISSEETDEIEIDNSEIVIEKAVESDTMVNNNENDEPDPSEEVSE